MSCLMCAKNARSRCALQKATKHDFVHASESLHCNLTALVSFLCKDVQTYTLYKATHILPGNKMIHADIHNTTQAWIETGIIWATNMIQLAMPLTSDSSTNFQPAWFCRCCPMSAAGHKIALMCKSWFHSLLHMTLASARNLLGSYMLMISGPILKYTFIV